MTERTVRIDDDVYEQLKGVAEKEGVPISYLIRIALDMFLEGYSHSLGLLDMDRAFG